MGTGTNSTDTQKRVTSQRCSICRSDVDPECTWHQGRCPHRPSLVDQILADPYKSRFYNLFKIFKRK